MTRFHGDDIFVEVGDPELEPACTPERLMNLIRTSIQTADQIAQSPLGRPDIVPHALRARSIAYIKTFYGQRPSVI